MPRCEGLPDGPCPRHCNDSSVKVGEGDLLLCKSCDEERFRQFVASRPPSMSSSTVPSDMSVQTASTSQVQAGHANVKKQNKSTRSNRPASANAAVPDKPASSFDNSSQDTRDEVFECDDAMRSVRSNRKVLINELLAYASFYRNKGTHDKLQNIVITFFSSTQITEAKKLLIEEFGGHLGASSVLTERRTTTVRAAHEAELDDIFAAFDLLDAHSVLDGCHFVALNLDLLPKYAPEDTSSGSIELKQTQIENNIERLAGDICQLKQKIDNLENLNVSIDQLHTKLDTRCAVDNVPVRQTTNAATNIDRSLNLVVFGVDENRDAEVWRDKIDDVLQFVTGRQVDVMDMYRIGRYVVDKCRPVLVKLRTVWDRRVVLSSCSKLKNYSGRVFICPDEPPEARRKRVFERIRATAERDGKVVTVDRDVLYVDGVAKYSLKDGAINNNGRS